MTEEQRKAIFSKEVWTIADIVIVFELDTLSPSSAYNEAATIMREIKRKGFDRLHTQGKIHVQDYIDCYRLDIARYTSNPIQIKRSEENVIKKEEARTEENVPTPRRDLLRSKAYIA